MTALLLVILGATCGKAADTDTEIKRIVARVNAAETQLDRAIFYELKTEDAADESKLTEQVWLTEAGDWLKVREDRVGKSGRELAEIWFQDGNAAAFLLRRKESPAENGGTRVEEWRSYYDKDALIR